MKKEIIKKPSIKDVASKAGVTIGTVSHVINGTAHVTEKTRQKVNKAIKELHYKPNSMARGLRKRKSFMVGLLIPDITNEYYSQVAKSFMDMAYTDGYTVMLCGFQYSLEREKVELDILVEKSVDAIVVIGSNDDDLHILNSIRELGIPIVLGDRRSSDTNYPTVEFNNTETMQNIVTSLVQAGYTRIGYITEALAMSNLKDRYDGFISGMNNEGLAVDKESIIVDENLQMDKIGNSYKLMHAIIHEKNRTLPEVFIATSDLIAIGIMGAIKDADLRVPKDIGIISFDNLAVSQFFEPALTTVNQNASKLGESTWNLVISYIKNKELKEVHKVLTQEIIIRKSTK